MGISEIEANDWILCTDNIPDEDGQYEVTMACEKKEGIPQEFIRSVRYYAIEKKGRDKDICGWEHDSVIAWRPRAKPYGD